MGDKKEINVALVSTPNYYLKYMAATIESIYYNRNKNYNYNIYLFTLWKVTDLDKKKLDNKYDADFHIKFIGIDEKIFFQYKNLKNNNYVYYIRLLIWDYLDNVDKVLYMDCDIVVNWDISELFFTDLWNNVIWAAKDCINWSNYGGEKKILKRYFNTGVQLINLNLWKEKNIWKKILNEINNNESIYGFWDQDGINYVLDWQIKAISSKRNWMWWNKIWYKESQYTKNEYKELNNPVIVHYAGDTNRPRKWLICLHPYRYLYFKYIFKTKFWDYSDISMFLLRIFSSNFIIRYIGKIAITIWWKIKRMFII